jgi:KUP system potassium uptake protein
MTHMITWRDGRSELARRLGQGSLPIAVFLDDIAVRKPSRVPGTAVFMSVSTDGTPIPLLHNYKHNKIIHEQVLLLSIVSAGTPHVAPQDRLDITPLGQGFFRIVARYGFMETPSVPDILALASARSIPLDLQSTSFYLGRETLLTSGSSRMMTWRKALFAFMSRNAWNATTYFGIPPGRVVELGSQIEF